MDGFPSISTARQTSTPWPYTSGKHPKRKHNYNFMGAAVFSPFGLFLQISFPKVAVHYEAECKCSDLSSHLPLPPISLWRNDDASADSGVAQESGCLHYESEALPERELDRVIGSAGGAGVWSLIYSNLPQRDGTPNPCGSYSNQVTWRKGNHEGI